MARQDRRTVDDRPERRAIIDLVGTTGDDGERRIRQLAGLDGRILAAGNAGTTSLRHAGENQQRETGQAEERGAPEDARRPGQEGQHRRVR
jgi:hypothetical protein